MLDELKIESCCRTRIIINSQLLSNQTIKQSSKLDYIIKHIKSLIIYNITCEMM